MSLRHPRYHPHSSRPIDAARTIRASTASGHITAASQPVPTVLPHQESTLQEKATADGPNVVLRPSVLRVPTKPAESETVVRYSRGKDSQQSLSSIASPSSSNHVEAAAQAPNQYSPLVLPALITADAPLEGAPEKPTTITHQRPISFSTSASFQSTTTDASPPKLGAADNSISTLLTDANSAIPTSLIPSTAEDLGLLISMALAGNALTSTLDPMVSNPTLLTDADSVVSAFLTIPVAHSLGPSGSMAISGHALTPNLRPIPASASPNSHPFTSLIDSSAEAEAPESRISGEPTRSPGGPKTNTTPLHLAENSKPTPSLATSNAFGVSITGSLTSTAPTLSPSHPVSNAAKDLARTRRGGLAVAVLVLVWYCLVL